jgi:hypothetical protein
MLSCQTDVLPDRLSLPSPLSVLSREVFSDFTLQGCSFINEKKKQEKSGL